MGPHLTCRQGWQFVCHHDVTQFTKVLFSTNQSLHPHTPTPSDADEGGRGSQQALQAGQSRPEPREVDFLFLFECVDIAWNVQVETVLGHLVKAGEMSKFFDLFRASPPGCGPYWPELGCSDCVATQIPCWHPQKECPCALRAGHPFPSPVKDHRHHRDGRCRGWFPAGR